MSLNEAKREETKEMPILNVGNAALSPSMPLVLMALAGLHWVMPTAQQASALLSALSNPTEIKTVLSEDPYPKFEVSMCGIPTTLDDTLPPSTIELRLGKKILARMENLAIPVACTHDT